MSSDHQSSDRRVNDRPELALVAALDEHRVIGKDGTLPWHLPADLRHFKNTTSGHPVIMGRNTYESLGKPLPGRENIILTSRQDYEASGCAIAHDIDEAVDAARDSGADCAMILGGETVFRQTLPHADQLILTVVHGEYDGDTFFPGFQSEDWEVVKRRFHGADDNHESAMTFLWLKAAVEHPRRVDGESGTGPLPKVLRNSL